MRARARRIFRWRWLPLALLAVGLDVPVNALPEAPPKTQPNEHWSFRAPRRPTLPRVRAAGRTLGAIDSFVEARLEREPLDSSPRAGRATLIRRASLDLTGLPPSPQQVRAFVEDPAPDAYARLVDRLLTSPHFGERWAVWWLDAVRYADTNGYETDRTRTLWPYRDWVIDALNDDMAFDRFTIEQIAGDLLPDATLSQRVATGFHRNTYINEEGGHDWEQFRFESIVDRVHTTATVFLGLTLACAQCHDHKYDPVSQREYFQFFAFLNNADEPELEVPVANALEARRAAEAQIAQLVRTRSSTFPLPAGTKAGGSGETANRQQHLENRLAEWIQDAAGKTQRWHVLKPLRFRSELNATMETLEDGAILVSGDRPEIDTYTIDFETPLESITAFRLEALPHPSLPDRGPGRGSMWDDGSFALSEFEVTTSPLDATGAEATAQNIVKGSFRRVTSTFEHEKGPAAHAVDGDRHTSWRTDKSHGRAVFAVFEATDPLGFPGGTRLRLRLVQNLVHQQTLGHFRLSVTTAPEPFVVSGRSKELDDLLLEPQKRWSAEQRQQVRDHFLSVAPELKELNERIQELENERPKLPATLILSEREQPRPTHLHVRGDFRRPAEQVPAGVPRALHPLPSGSPRDRLTLARWLASKSNPLVARVIVNQIWQIYFGRGLVATPEDFGSQGEPPTHPKLLDWLATEFMRQGWSLKALHRAIVTSAVYCQSSRVDSAALETDPENRLLARGPRFRADAEVIRDIALTAAGLLEHRLGGPSVFPPQPVAVNKTSFGGDRWTDNTDGKRYRRGLYTFRKRSNPYPCLATFDAPGRNICSVKRQRSNTPLQALTLLNDITIVEASRAMAQRVLEEAAPTRHARITYAFRLCVSRDPEREERDVLQAFLERQVTRLQNGELPAATVVGKAPSPNGPKPATMDHAAWTVLCRALLNLDETITKE